MSWIIALIIGGIVGWLASIIMKTNAEMGIIANVLVGVVGSLLGNWIAGLLGIVAQGNILRFLIALGGAVLLILILQQVGFFRKRAAEHRH
ncbi:transglycosylase [Sulfurifustis variabilis]|uniref:Transglycosylase n=1 Tax=Sulfurifustis variabilis TaxID=1675686 RepID=A0A1B4V750_9GAMM|nr:GlsB/YeaQ/YmgE family stress response membrane protein [Sulfurifustis variabilis]BAU49370.1 transglycosylase [Sulfurifustis variabilis]